jgi:hypothetical protein
MISSLSVLVQLEHLMSYPIVRSRVLAGELRLNGWWFDVPSGAMHAYDRNSRRFEIIDRRLAEQLSRNSPLQHYESQGPIRPRGSMGVKLKIAIACQGGGSQTAFTAGVLHG